jgi:hypothetical protein
MTVTINRKLLIETYDTTKTFTKEAKKFKEWRDKMGSVCEAFKALCDTHSASNAQTFEIPKQLCVDLLKIFMFLIK